MNREHEVLVDITLLELLLCLPHLNHRLEIDSVGAIRVGAADRTPETTCQLLVFSQNNGGGVPRPKDEFTLRCQVEDRCLLLETCHQSKSDWFAGSEVADVVTVEDSLGDGTNLSVVDVTLEKVREDVVVFHSVAGIEDEAVVREGQKASLVVDLA